MSNFYSEKLKTANDNIQVLDLIQQNITEKKAAHIREKFTFALRYNDFSEMLFYDSHEILKALYSELRQFEISPAPSEINRKETEFSFKDTQLHSAFLLSKLFKEKLSSLGKLTIQDFLKINEVSPVTENEIISYLKTSYSDTAYSIFSGLLNTPSVSYQSDFNSVCEAVYYDKSKYAILPLENTFDGRLSGFYNLIYKYELKIVKTCNVFYDDTQKTRFCLCTKNLDVIKSDSGIYFLDIMLDISDRLSEVTRCAEYFNLTISRIDSVPVSYSESKYLYEIVFCGKDDDILSLLLFLYFENFVFSYMGIYSEI